VASACRPLGHPPIEELLIDLSVFPDGWTGDVDGPSPIAQAPLGGTKPVKSTEVFFYIYGNGIYFVNFSAGMVPNYMSYDDFEDVLQAIDEKMAGYADK
jgi:hypothetical protein